MVLRGMQIRRSGPAGWILFTRQALLSCRMLKKAASGVLTSRRGFAVRDFNDYMKQLERRGVVVDQEARRTMVLAQLDTLARAGKGVLHRDDDLLEQAVYTVEYPSATEPGPPSAGSRRNRFPRWHRLDPSRHSFREILRRSEAASETPGFVEATSPAAA